MDDQRVREIAELEVRRYFDSYLQRVFPEQVKVLKAHTLTEVGSHNASPEAHGGVERKVSRFLWLLLGGATVTGGGFGALVAKLASFAG